MIEPPRSETILHGAYRHVNPTVRSETDIRLTSRKSKRLILTRKKDIDRDRILDAAEAVILESGGRSFTPDAVAAHAGISKGGLVYGFATRDDLVHAALERGNGALSGRNYRPDKSIRYQHIDALFGDEIDWDLIATHARDMIQLVLSMGLVQNWGSGGNRGWRE